MTITNFKCSHCNQEKQHEPDFTTGYAIYKSGEKVCFNCCGVIDRADLARNNKGTLYLSRNAITGGYELTNWPGTFRIFINHTPRKGSHNLARYRYDVWFTFDGSEWHGVQYGDNTQLCHVRRLKAAATCTNEDMTTTAFKQAHL